MNLIDYELIIKIGVIVLILVAIIALIALILFFKRTTKTMAGVDVVMNQLQTTIDETNVLIGYWKNKSQQMDEPINNIITAGKKTTSGLLSVFDVVERVAGTLSSFSLLGIGKKHNKNNKGEAV